MSAEMIDPAVVTADGGNTDRSTGKTLSKWTLYSRRFMRNRAAVGGIVIFVLLALFSILGPLLSPWEQSEMDFLSLSTGPSAEHWFGTNASGNDTFTQTAVGLQRSLMMCPHYSSWRQRPMTN